MTVPAQSRAATYPNCHSQEVVVSGLDPRFVVCTILTSFPPFFVAGGMLYPARFRFPDVSGKQNVSLLWFSNSVIRLLEIRVHLLNQNLGG